MPESVLRCPGCGAPAAADAVACAYCRSALATLTCASCFASMFVGSRFCAHCGAEARRELIDEETPLACPRCRDEMQALRLGTTVGHECATCGGLWLAPAALQHLSDAHSERDNVIEVLAARKGVAPAAADVVRYIGCPNCSKLMNRTNFARSSGVILDVCKNHGVWLDRGELQRVLGFIDGGGLTLARAREREQLADEQRRLLSLANQSAGHAAEYTQRVHSVSSTLITPSNAIERFLLDALGVVR